MFFVLVPPKCGLLLPATEPKIKEGENVDLHFYPEKMNAEFVWLDKHGNTIITDGISYSQKSRNDLYYVLTLHNITGNQTGDYKVQCYSGIETNTVRIEVVGKYCFILINKFVEIQRDSLFINVSVVRVCVLHCK